MNEGESCENCRYFLKTEPNQELQRERICRRFPPMVFLVQQAGQTMTRSFFPPAVENMWCGEWSPSAGYTPSAAGKPN